MNVLFVRELRKYCSLDILCKIWLTVPIQHQSGSLERSYQFASSAEGDMTAPMPQNHFLSSAVDSVSDLVRESTCVPTSLPV